MAPNNMLFISLNYHSYQTNKKIISSLPRHMKVRHIAVIDKKQPNQDYGNAEMFCYTSIFSQLKLYGLLLTFLFSKPCRAVVLPHFDIPLIRLMVSIVTNNKSLLLIVPDGVMFPSDFDYIHQRVGKKISIEKIKTFPASFYGLINKKIAVIATKRDTLYSKSYVIGFGQYFWEYYKLLHVKKERYFPFGNPMFDSISTMEKEDDKKQKLVSYFLQPFVEENWIDLDTFVSVIRSVEGVFKKQNVKLAIKLHPRQDAKKYEALFTNELKRGIMKFISGGDNFDLIKKSDFVMSYNSTVMCDVILLKKALVVFDLFHFNRHNEYREYLRLEQVTSLHELENLIKRFYSIENHNIFNNTEESLINSFLTNNPDSAKSIALFLQSELV